MLPRTSSGLMAMSFDQLNILHEYGLIMVKDYNSLLRLQIVRCE